jgi:hypothetical protein
MWLQKVGRNGFYPHSKWVGANLGSPQEDPLAHKSRARPPALAAVASVILDRNDCPLTCSHSQFVSPVTTSPGAASPGAARVLCGLPSSCRRCRPTSCRRRRPTSCRRLQLDSCLWLRPASFVWFPGRHLACGLGHRPLLTA